MTRLELADKTLNCRRELQWLENIETNCVTCEYKETGSDMCKKFGAIPADFIQQGCAEWSFDDVPF
jgi:dephospho-CoA kinase